MLSTMNMMTMGPVPCSLGLPKGKYLDNAHLYQILCIWVPAIQGIKKGASWPEVVC